MPRALAAFEWTVAFDMFMVCSHDRTLYQRAKAAA